MRVVGTSRSALAFRTWQLRPPRPSLTVVCKQTLTLTLDGPSALSEEPVPCVAGAYHDDDPEQSLRHDDDLALFKPRGEWLLAGTCHPPRPTPTSAVGVRVGALAKRLAVFGDRHFTAMGLGISEPVPFTSMPLRWERSFGGPGVPANPLGRGVEPVDASGGRRVPLPNIEDPAALVRGPSSRPPPCGAFPIPPTWRPRADLTGTYDERWRRTRWPYLPEDFAWEHFNAAPVDQRLTGYWRGDEAIVLENLVEGTAIARTRLPGIRPRLFLVPVGGDARALVEVRLSLDTITIDGDARQIYCAWRGLHELAREDLADIAAIFVVDDPLEAPRDRRALEAEYQAILDAEAADEAAFALAPIPEPVAPAPASHVPSHALHPTPAAAAITDSPSPPRSPPAPRATPSAAPRSPPASHASSSPPRDDLDALQRLRAMYLAASLPIPAELERRLAEVTGVAAPAPVAPLTALATPQPAAPPLAAAPAPPPRDPQRAAAGRAIAIAALQGGRSLAGLDLAEADLSDLDLHGRDLRGAILRGAALTRARLGAADLSKAILAEADLEGADLEGADLEGADLSAARASGARAPRARLRGALASRADLAAADLSEADLAAADLSEANLSEADLSGARANGVDLSRAKLTRAKITRVDLREASIEGVDATALVLRGSVLADIRADADTRLDRADLRECDARGAHLAGASLTEANLTRVPLARADLRGADLTRAHLAGADLQAARLEGANLAGASLLRADLAGAILTGADLQGADLRGACLVGAELWKARVDRARLELADLRGTKLAGDGGRPR